MLENPVKSLVTHEGGSTRAQLDTSSKTVNAYYKQFFMKLFKTNGMNVIKISQLQFGCNLPSSVLQKHTD